MWKAEDIQYWKWNAWFLYLPSINLDANRDNAGQFYIKCSCHCDIPVVYLKACAEHM